MRCSSLPMRCCAPTVRYGQLRDRRSPFPRTSGIKLPQRYVDLLYVRNGGTPVRPRCPTNFETSWAPDHFEISAILGIGGSPGLENSAYMIAEWEYPDIGLVICSTPSGGHDTVMLDRSGAVVYIDEDRVPRQAARSIEEFVAMLY
ncbi:SMI1/KNR4 family protein [Kibdelosporangium philippinense]